MKVWISKYALSEGIFAAEGEIDQKYPGMVIIRRRQFDEYFHGEGLQWHRTPEAAIYRAKTMRIAKIASLKRQIAKLEKLEFEAFDPSLSQAGT